MDITRLKQIVRSSLNSSGQFSLLTTALGSASIDHVSDDYLPANMLRLAGATIEERSDGNSIVARGTGVDFPFNGLASEISFYLVGNEAAFVFSAKAGVGWTLATGFPPFNNTLAATLRFLSSPQPTLVLSSQPATDGNNAGLSFDGTIDLQALPGGLAGLVGVTNEPVSGQIVLKERGSKLIGVDLAAPPAKQANLGIATVSDLSFKVGSRLDRNPVSDSVYPTPYIEFAAEIPFTAQGVRRGLPVSVQIANLNSSIRFSADLTEGVDAALDEVKALTNQVGLDGLLPSDFNVASVIKLDPFFFDFDPSSSSKVSLVGVGLKSATTWKILRLESSNKDVVAQNIQLTFLLYDPFGVKNKSLSISGEVAIGSSGIVVIQARYPAWSIQAYLKKGTRLKLAEVLEEFMSAGADVPEMDVTIFDLEVLPGSYALQVALEGFWPLGSLPIGIERVGLSLSYQTGSGLTAGIRGTVAFGEVDVSVTADYRGAAAGWLFTGSVPRLSLSSLAKYLPDGISLPDEIPDVEFTDLFLSMTPKTGEFIFRGTCTTRWDLPFGVSNLAVSTLDINLSRGPSTGTGTQTTPGPVSCTLKLTGAGPVTIVDGLVFKSFSLTFSLAGQTSWSLSGSVAANVFDVDYTLAAGLEETPALRKISLSTTIASATPLLTLAGIGSLDADAFAVSISKAKQATAATPGVSMNAASPYNWDVTATGSIKVDGVFTFAGTLQLFKRTDATGFAFRAQSAQLQIPIPVPGYSIKTFLGLEYISVVRTTSTTGPPTWSFDATIDVWFTGLPATFQNILATKIVGRFKTDSTGTIVSINRLTQLVEFTVPNMSIGSASMPIGKMAFDASNFMLSLGTNTTLSMDFGLGLPQSLNTIFGARSDGTPSVRFFNTYESGKPETVTKFRIAIDTTAGVNFTIITSPIKAIRLVQQGLDTWFYADLGDFGEIRFMVPVFNYDGTSFTARGGFEQVKDRPLKIPLTPLKLLLQAANLKAAADALPAGIPLTELSLVDERNNFRFKDFITAIETLGGFKVPAEVIDTLKIMESRFDALPDRFKSYLKIEIPDRFEFNISITTDGGTRGRIWVQGDKPIKFLMPTVGPIGPQLRGTELYGLTFGEILGGQLLILNVDARVDTFDLVTLALALVLPLDKLPLAPNTRALTNRFIIKDLFMLVIYQTVIPIPVPLFFGELGIEYLGLEGIAFQTHWGFPKPKLNMGEASAIFSQFKRFFTDHNYLLDAGKAPKDLTLQLNIGSNYIGLPKYLGGSVLGTQRPLAPINAFENLAHLLNFLKTLTLNEVVQAIPLDQRVGNEQVIFGPLNIKATWLMTTPDEFKRVAYQRLNASSGDTASFLAVLPAVPAAKGGGPNEQGVVLFLRGSAAIKNLANLDTVFGLAASGSMGFNTGFKVTGSIANFVSMDLGGVVVINPKGTTQITQADKTRSPQGASTAVFQLSGHSYLSILGNQVFKGDIQVIDDRFWFKGALTLFPPNSPLQVNGTLEGSLNRTDFNLSGDVTVALAGLPLSSAKGIFSNQRVFVSGSWLGQTASLDVKQDKSTLLLRGLVTVGVRVELDLGIVTKVVGNQNVKLADNVRLKLDVTASLDVTIANSGFSATVTAQFKVNNQDNTVKFNLTVAPADTSALIYEIKKRVISEPLTYFNELYADAAGWLKGVASGGIQWVSDAYRDTGRAFRYGYGQTEAQVTSLLQSAGWSAKEAGSVLAKGYDLGADAMARTLKQAGYLATDVGSALHSVYGYGADQVASTMKSVGYGAYDVGKALQSTFGTGTEEAARIFHSIGFKAQESADALNSVFHASASQVGGFMQGLWGQGDQAINSILRGAGFASKDVDNFMSSAFDWGKDTGKKILDGLSKY